MTTNRVQAPSSPIDCLNWIAGNWRPGTGSTLEIRSPYFGTVVGKGAGATAQDLNEAVASARKAFQDWARTPIKERCTVLLKFREILQRDIDAISHRISLESGKTLAEARAGLLKGIEVTDYAVSLQNIDQGGRMEVSRGVFCEYRREPLGVVAGITPFNFPAMVPLWMIPIALAAGNTFIWKPSDKVPLTSLLIGHALAEAGLPQGVFQIVQGGRDVVEAILDHPGISAVGFVGSSPVARTVYDRGTRHNKRVLALGGAKNPIILMPDADPEMAAQGITDSYTGCAGQRCMAASLLYAVGDSTAIIQKVIERSQAIRLGETMGALISKESALRICESIARAQQAGAQIVLDGRNPHAPEGYAGGNWMAPTVLDGVKPGSEAACSELFGPVLSILPVKNLSEALALENQSSFGNACSVFTSSGAVAERVAQEAQAGMIGVNIGVPVPREPFSFGGTKESRFGQGDITGESGLNFWTQLKKITVKWAPASRLNSQGQLQSSQNWMS